MTESRKTRRIGVVTTSRADYSHLYWPLRELAADPNVELGIFALGAHLSPEFGLTLKEIEHDGFPIRGRIECLLSSDTDTGMAKTIGIAMLGLTEALTAWRPDLLLLIADRYEMLAPAAVALALRIPMAHIEGGEVSQGAIDDQVRNALTKLAHLHFTSTSTARLRVIGMGEEPSRVHHAGAPSLDHLRRSALLDRAALEAKLGVGLKRPTILVAWHPVTILMDTNAEAEALFAALRLAPGQLVFVYPNSDAGGHALIERTKRLVATRPGTQFYVNLDAVTYWSLLGQVDAMVGNSSSGIMEAASFALPVVNVGMRQQGRERALNIIDVPAESGVIASALGQALSPAFRQSLEGMTNPYGDGTAARTIARVLSSVALEGLLIKRPAPVPADIYPAQSNEELREELTPVLAAAVPRPDHRKPTSLLSIVVDAEAMSRSKQGTIFGPVSFALADQVFPAPGYTDLAVAFVSEWLEGIVLVALGQKNYARVRYYHNPYSIDISAGERGSADLEFIWHSAAGDKLLASLSMRLRELMKQSVEAAERILETCEQRGWSDPDTQKITRTLKDAKKALRKHAAWGLL
jgi:UDP-hydrolysing UDP-N-acetyl-D-glucosamine 2-epimerase